METFAGLSGQLHPSSDGVPADPLEAAPPSPAAFDHSESLEAVRETLRAAELRLAYFERFGPWVEEQMAAVVERAATIERESERQRAEATEDAARLRAEASEEVARLRAEAAQEIAQQQAKAVDEIEQQRAQTAEEIVGVRQAAEREHEEITAGIDRRRQELAGLQAECERRGEEAQATIAHAHKTAEFVMGRLNESASGIVQRAIADFETLRAELTPEALAATAASVPVPAEPEAADGRSAGDADTGDDRRRGWLPFGK